MWKGGGQMVLCVCVSSKVKRFKRVNREDMGDKREKCDLYFKTLENSYQGGEGDFLAFSLLRFYFPFPLIKNGFAPSGPTQSLQ